MEFDSKEKVVKNSVKISLESPIGLAIKGKKAGDEVKMRLPTGKKDVKIIDVK
jgi:transcription elongation GreA/GreB family factor